MTRDLVTQTLTASLDHVDSMYVPAAEPFITEGTGYQNVQGVIINKNGTVVIDSVIANQAQRT